MTRVAVVGCGAIARHAHMPAWLALPDVEIAAIYDPDPSAGASLKSRFKLTATVFESFDALLRCPRLDIVDICSPPQAHGAQALSALRAGLNVLVEKPPAMSVRELERVLEEASRRSLKAGAVMNFRYYDVLQEAKRNIEAGLLGSITKLHALHHCNNVYSESAHLWDERSSKYLLYDFGIHYIDALLFMGGPFERLIDVLPRPHPVTQETTELLVRMELAGGVLATLEVSADFTRHSSHQSCFNVFGTAMDMHVRRFPPLVRLQAGLANPMRMALDECRVLARMSFRLLANRYLRERNASHRRVLRDYLAWVRGEGAFDTPLQSTLALVSLLDAIAGRVPAYSVT